MRILVDSSNYFVDNENLGDRAIFQAVGGRLLGIWPDASISFITGNHGLIEATHPGLRPVVLGTRTRMEGGPEFESYFAEVEAADLVVATGGGYYSDAFAAHALSVLNTLEAACQLGKPAVMMGAGFEPVRDEALLTKARWVLPRLSLIACREGATGPGYLHSLGVQPSRVVVTGDDTVELAYESRRATLGDAIGVNLREAPYAGEHPPSIPVLRSVLTDAAIRHRATLLPVPISLHGPSDPESIAKLLGPTRQPAQSTLRVDTLQEVLEQVSRCRVVVTGSYHAAVFALSQGIPVVGIGNSLHYLTKLRGLAYQFGDACTIVAVRDEGFREGVTNAIDSAWVRADELRPGLLAAAAEQIAAGRAAYRRLQELIQHQSSPDQRPSAQGQVRRYQEALSALSRDRDALQLVSRERQAMIGVLQATCDLRQREIREISAEAQRREEVIRELVTELTEVRRALVERTAWAERMVLEAERRGDVIDELLDAVEERTAWAKRLMEEAERRGTVIAGLQAALTAKQEVIVLRGYRRLKRLLERLGLAHAVWWAFLLDRVASVPPSGPS